MEDKEKQYDYFDLVLRHLGMNVNRKTLEGLYDSAMLVHNMKGKATLKDMSHLRLELDKRHPYIIRWNKGGHAENHMI